MAMQTFTILQGARGCRRTAALFVLLTAFVGPARADDIRWRHDYSGARKEAQERDLPLLLDFGTETCHWCKRLDATTFRHETIVSVINQRFIPLKVDAEKQSTLAEALHIRSYPTLVLAGSDGKIIGTLEGYLDASRLHEQLQRVLAVVANPEWMTQDYQEAIKAMQAADSARAIALLKSVVEDGKDRAVQVRARQTLKELEQQATDKLAAARQKEQTGKSADAILALSELVRTYSGTAAATEGGKLLGTLTAKGQAGESSNPKRGQELLAQAKEDLRSQQYLCCLDRCELVCKLYADSSEAEEARRMADEIRNNPDWLQQACDNLVDRLGSLYMSMAENWQRKGQMQLASACYERVLTAAPGSRYAELAQLKLSALKPRTKTTALATDKGP
jgi:thioredoxin-related protein